MGRKTKIRSNLLEFPGDGGDLFHTILMSCQIAFERFVLLLESFELVETALPEIAALEHLLLAPGPFLVDVGLVLEFLGQMLKTF